VIRLANILSTDEIKRLQKHLNKLIQEMGLTDLETKYQEEIQKIQQGMNEIMAESEINKPDVMVPLADVEETDDSIVVSMDLPGVDKKDVEISISNEELHVRAQRSAQIDVEEKGYHKRERSHAKFERMVKLPVAVIGEESKAKLTDGVLEITLPKEIVTTRKRIAID
jgi:HSP20 family protein